MTPIAVGEVFNTIYDCQTLITEQLIDFIRTTVVHAGGITHLRRIAALAELYHVRTGSHGATDLSPVCMGAALNFDIWVHNFGIQEYMRHTPETDAVFSAMMFLGKVVAASFLVLSMAPGHRDKMKVRSAVVAVPLRSRHLDGDGDGDVIRRRLRWWWKWDLSTSTLYLDALNTSTKLTSRRPSGSGTHRGRIDPDHGHPARSRGTRKRRPAGTEGATPEGLVLIATAVILGLAAAGAIVRIAIGPSLLDRGAGIRCCFGHPRRGTGA